MSPHFWAYIINMSSPLNQVQQERRHSKYILGCTVYQHLYVEHVQLVQVTARIISKRPSHRVTSSPSQKLDHYQRGFCTLIRGVLSVVESCKGS